MYSVVIYFGFLHVMISGLCTCINMYFKEWAAMQLKLKCGLKPKKGNHFGMLGLFCSHAVYDT